VLPQLLPILLERNTTHLMPFALRATKRFFKSPVIPSTIKLTLCLSTLIVRLVSTCWFSAFVSFGCKQCERQPNYTSAFALVLSFRTVYLTYCLPPFYGRSQWTAYAALTKPRLA